MSGKTFRKIILLLIPPFLLAWPVYAVYSGSSSPHYSVYQVFFGTGSTQPSNPTTSTNYSTQASVGDLGIGNSVSNDYQAYAGYNTSDSPYIQMVVTATNLNLGILSSSSTTTATSTFYVREWLGHGYSVYTFGSPPTDGSYTMATPAPTTNATNSVGTEQFGMNLEANTVPISFGAAPSQATSYSYGQVAAPYSTANYYAYNNGDIIADSTQSTSSTIFTVSYVFNISSTTYSGQYVFTQSLVATGTY